MNSIRRSHVLHILCSLALAGAAMRCSKNPNPAGPGALGYCGSQSTLHGTMSGTINGAAWASASVTTSLTSGMLTIQGSDGCNPVRIITFGLQPGGPGKFTIAPVTPSGLNAILGIGGLNVWIANVSGGGGSVTVDTLTAAGATGKFTFNVVPVAASGATGNKDLDGTFNVIF